VWPAGSAGPVCGVVAVRVALRDCPVFVVSHVFSLAASCFGAPSLDGLGLRGRGSLGVRQHPQLVLPAPIGGSGSWASRPRSRLSGVVVASAAPQPLQKAAPTGVSRPQLVQMSTR
jgi:hypothetical protein